MENRFAALNASAKAIASLIGSRRSEKRVDQRIAASLREAIRKGKIPLGTTLPSTQALARELKANLNSVNHALALLAAEGFLERRRHVGTVVTSPERKQRLVFCLFAEDLKQEAFFMARLSYRLLEEELVRRNYRVRYLDNLVTLALPDPDVRASAIQGFTEELTHFPPTAFVFHSFLLERFAELRSYYAIPGVFCKEVVTIPKNQLFLEGIPYLRKCGCKRVVLVTFSSVTRPSVEFFMLFWEQLKVHKMNCEEVVELYDALLQERTTEECQIRLSKLLELRARKPREERFDALIVTDDTAMRGAASALLKAGIDVPSEIRVLVQTNRGINHHYGLHVDRLELPVENYIKAVVDSLEAKILTPSKPLPRQVVKRVLKPSAPLVKK